MDSTNSDGSGIKIKTGFNPVGLGPVPNHESIVAAFFGMNYVIA